jgi:protein-disulfide isomerase
LAIILLLINLKNMKIFFNNKFSVPLFVFASLIGLFVFGALFVMVKAVLFAPAQTYSSAPNYLSTDFSASEVSVTDPFITKNPNVAEQIVGPVISAANPTLGDAQASVIVVEYGDYNCKICSEVNQATQAVVARYGNKIKLVWKDYPTDNTESVDFQAAVAARCANQQGKFWEYQNLLFAQNQNFKTETFIDIAKSLSLDTGDFKKCLNNEATATLVKNDITEANALGINGVPMVFVNKQEMYGANNKQEAQEMLIRLIDSELNRNNPQN